MYTFVVACAVLCFRLGAPPLCDRIVCLIDSVLPVPHAVRIRYPALLQQSTFQCAVTPVESSFDLNMPLPAGACLADCSMASLRLARAEGLKT